MEVVHWGETEVEQLSAGIGRQVLNGEAMTLARITLRAGAVVPEHRHDNEQIATVLSGRLRFVIGDEEREVGGGESVLVPGGVASLGGGARRLDRARRVRAAPRGLAPRRRRIPPRLAQPP